MTGNFDSLGGDDGDVAGDDDDSRFFFVSAFATSIFGKETRRESTYGWRPTNA